MDWTKKALRAASARATMFGYLDRGHDEGMRVFSVKCPQCVNEVRAYVLGMDAGKVPARVKALRLAVEQHLAAEHAPPTP